MNRKALTPQLILIVVGLVALAIIIAMLSFSGTARFVVIGAGMVVGSIYVFVKGGRSQKKAVFALVLLAVGSVFILSSGIIQQTALAGGAYFERRSLVHSAANQPLARRTSGTVAIPADGRTIRCPENTKNCDVLLTVPDEGLITPPRRVEWYVCDPGFQNCQAANYVADISYKGFIEKVIRTNLPADKMLYVQLQSKATPISSWKGRDGATAKLSYIPYILWKEDSLRGGKNPVEGSTDCKVPTSSPYWMNRIIKATVEDSEGKQAQIRASNSQLQPSETYNYVSGTVTRATFGNSVTYNGKSGYCADNIQGSSQAVIYGFGTVQTASTTYTVVDLGQEIARVECCQENQVIGSQVCKNFKLEPLKVDETTGETNAECSLVNPCNPGKFALSDSDRTSFQYQCVSGKCVVGSVKREECTLTNQCPSDRVCVNFQCMLASTIPDAQPGTTTETPEEACTRKARENPFAGYTLVTRTTDPSGIQKAVTIMTLGLVGDLSPETTVSCEAKFIPYYIFGGIFLVMVIGIIVLMKQPRKGGRKRR